MRAGPVAAAATTVEKRRGRKFHGSLDPRQEWIGPCSGGNKFVFAPEEGPKLV
jgi:hypothetical protein